MKLYELVNDVSLQGDKIVIARIAFTDSSVGLNHLKEYEGEVIKVPEELEDLEVLYIYPENGNLIVEVSKEVVE